MNLQFATLEAMQGEVRRWVLRDRLAFLHGLDADGLTRGTLLDLHHQTVFRLLAEAEPAGLHDIIDHYVRDPRSRRNYFRIALTQTRDLLEDETGADTGHIDTTKVAGGYSYTSSVLDSTLQPFVALAALLRERDPNAIVFSSPQGFGYFPAQDVSRANGLEINTVHRSRYTSVGGMMYYCFNPVVSQPSFLQVLPVHVLARTWIAMVNHADILMAQTRFPHQHVLTELVAYARETEAWQERVESDLAAFLIAHERGHDPGHPGNKILFDIMADLGIPRQDFYTVGFPTEQDFRAWDRIRVGQGRPRDVLFLLGDFLANMAIIEDSIGRPSHKLLRAFNWWLVKEIKANSRPRGLTNFLAHSYDYRLEQHRKCLRELLNTAARHPCKLKSALCAFDAAGWQAIDKIGARLARTKGINP